MASWLYNFHAYKQTDDVRFANSLDGNRFTDIGSSVEGAFLSTTVAGGFVGNMVGLYATSGNDIR